VSWEAAFEGKNRMFLVSAAHGFWEPSFRQSALFLAGHGVGRLINVY
jgi:hypothetical protein